MHPLPRSRSLALIALIILFLFASCKEKQDEITRSYYYWQTDGEITPRQKEFIVQNRITKIYARILDVDWSEVYGAFPVTSVNIHRIHHQLNVIDSLSIDIVPVVFITNKSLDRIDSADLPLLATRLVRRCLPGFDPVDNQYEQMNFKQSDRVEVTRPREVQIDCDWTEKTAKKFFHLLKLVKNLLPSDSIRLSATIRLHQYKYYEKTGVPPVDRGILMVYNVTDLKEYKEGNSIFDESQAALYFSGKEKYPIPLDIALPAYSWGLIFRNQKFYQIENGIDGKALENSSFLSSTGNGFYKVVKDTVYRDLFLRPGDEIKLESIDEEQMMEAAKLAGKAVNSASHSIALFEMSDQEINRYKNETIDKVYRLFE